MDARTFDLLAQRIAAGSRRRLLGLIASLPLLAGVSGLLDAEESLAKDRRRRRKGRHKKRKSPGGRKQGCTPKGTGKVCAGRCGPVKNRHTCGKTVDCGACACDPACAVCFTCQDDANMPGVCVVDPAQQGAPCGSGNAVCQPDGACACVPLTACPGGTDCGSISDGCGGTLSCGGSCANPTPICLSNVCAACTSSSQCRSDLICHNGLCQACESNDQCGADELCHDSLCVACDVTCTGTAAACGTNLQTALSGSAATLFVCPGTYEGGFSIARTVTVIGAGEGDDPDSNTILDGADGQRVLEITGSPVALHRLRITGGEAGTSGGGGILSTSTSLTMHDCTVIGNRGRLGGGIAHSSGALAMTRCTVSDNVAPEGGGAPSGGGLRVTGQATLTDCLVANNTTAGGGGGIYVAATLTLAGTTTIRGNTAAAGGGIFSSNNGRSFVTIGADCRITGNTADDGEGGGIYRLDSGVVTLEGTENPSPIVTDNCHENCAGGAIAKCQSGGTCPP